jgi:hypothetical protein
MPKFDGATLVALSEALPALAEQFLTIREPTAADVEIAQQLLDLAPVLGEAGAELTRVSAMLGVFAAFANVANLTERNEQVASFDPDLADLLVVSATEAVAWAAES